MNAVVMDGAENRREQYRRSSGFRESQNDHPATSLAAGIPARVVRA